MNFGEKLKALMKAKKNQQHRACKNVKTNPACD